MSLRRDILVLIAPLFLLLAGVNGALLYAWEKAEAANGLTGQAVAAAVTTAAFASGRDDLAAALADPRRSAALRAAAANIPGLVGLYVGRGEDPPVRIAGSGAAEAPGRYDPPAKPLTPPIDLKAAKPLAVAVVAAGRDGYVVAQIDAAPLAAEIESLRGLVFTLLAGGGVVGVALAWRVGGRIAREVARNADMVAAIRAGSGVEESEARRLSLRETSDLAHAVRLMKTGVDGRLARADRELAMRDRRRDEVSSVAAMHAASFGVLDAQVAGAAVSVRLRGSPSPGVFYALAERDGAAGLVLGECGGETPSERLANALAARAYFERRWLEDPEARREAGRRAFGLERLAWCGWTRQAPQPFAPTLLEQDAGGQASAYLERSGRLTAGAVADDLSILLEGDGALAVVKPLSAQG